MTAAEYVKLNYVSAEFYETCFSFAFVRDPLARAYSLYRHIGRWDTFDRFVMHRLRGRLWEKNYWFVRPQADFVFDDAGSLAVTYVGRYESLRQDFTKVGYAIGCPGIQLSQVNSARTMRRLARGSRRSLLARRDASVPSWQSLHKRTQRALEQCYGVDFDLFHYGSAHEST